jgi:hypothetical protein
MTSATSGAIVTLSSPSPVCRCRTSVGSLPVTVVAVWRPATVTTCADRVTSMTSRPSVPATLIVSTAPSLPRSRSTLFTSATGQVADIARVGSAARGERDVLCDVRAVEDERVVASLTLDGVIPPAGIPREVVIVTAEGRLIRAAATSDIVVAGPAEQDVVAVAACDRVVSAPPSSVSFVIVARPLLAVSVSSPPRPERSRLSTLASTSSATLSAIALACPGRFGFSAALRALLCRWRGLRLRRRPQGGRPAWRAR